MRRGSCAYFGGGPKLECYGTVCNCPLLTEKETKSGPRGGIDFKVSIAKDICVSRWLGNGVVTLALTFAGVKAIDQVRR